MTRGRLHPLQSPDMVYAYVLSTGENFPRERSTGRSTAIALRTIAKALESPYQDIPIRDHYEAAHAHRRLAYIVHRMLSDLGLAGFEVNPTALTIRFGR